MSKNTRGGEQVRAAAALLESCDELNYVGFVEGSDLFEGVADVVVCDGFVGNVTIKSSAGVVKVIDKALRQDGLSLWRSQLASKLSSPQLRQLKSRVNPSQFNGASLPWPAGKHHKKPWKCHN